MYLISRHRTYKTEKIIDIPITTNKCINKTSGKNRIKRGNPFKINNVVKIKIINAGKKLIKLAKAIETGIK